MRLSRYFFCEYRTDDLRPLFRAFYVVMAVPLTRLWRRMVFTLRDARVPALAHVLLAKRGDRVPYPLTVLPMFKQFYGATYYLRKSITPDCSNADEHERIWRLLNSGREAELNGSVLRPALADVDEMSFHVVVLLLKYVVPQRKPKSGFSTLIINELLRHGYMVKEGRMYYTKKEWILPAVKAAKRKYREWLDRAWDVIIDIYEMIKHSDLIAHTRGDELSIDAYTYPWVYLTRKQVRERHIEMLIKVLRGFAGLPVKVIDEYYEPTITILEAIRESPLKVEDYVVESYGSYSLPGKEVKERALLRSVSK